MSPVSPEQKIPIACFGAPHGVRGCIRVFDALSASDPIAVADYPKWWCKSGVAPWVLMNVQMVRRQNNFHVAKLEQLNSRDEAAAWRHGKIAVCRGDFPPLGAGEFYWCDLLGMSVKNGDGKILGRVAEIMQNGAHDILRVQGRTETLVPFVDAHIIGVDRRAGVVQVDWLE